MKMVKTKVLLFALFLLAAFLFFEFRYKLSIYFQMIFTKEEKEVILSLDDKIEDFNYFFNTILYNNPSINNYDKMLGYKFEDNYEFYLNCIKATKTNEEFYAILDMVSEDISSCHTCIAQYSYDSIAKSKLHNAEKTCGSINALAYNLYWDKISNEVYDMPENNTAFVYIDGDYLSYSPSIFGGKGGLIKLTEIDNVKIDKYILDPDITGEFNYDKLNNKIYRYSIKLNNSVGKLVKAKFYNMSTGISEVTEVYIQTKSSPLTRGNYLDKNLLLFQETTPDTIIPYNDIEINEVYSGKDAYICEDMTNAVSYIRINNFDNSEGEKIKNEINKLDIKNPLIIDLRMNSGGTHDYLSNYLLSPVVSESFRVYLDFRSYRETFNTFGKNTLREKINFNRTITETDLDFIYGRKYFDIIGKAVSDCEIYVIIDTTSCSAADTFAYTVQKYDLGLIVGSDSGGEGVCDAAYVSLMPNSKIIFTFNGSESTILSENRTKPDVYLNQTAESFLLCRQYASQKKSVVNYSDRLCWDNILIETIEMIKEKETTK